VPHVSHQGGALNDGADVLGLGHQRRGSAQHFRNPALGKVRGGRHKKRAFREGGEVFVGLDSAQVKHSFRLLRPHQSKDAGVRPNEKLVVHLDNSVRMVGRFHRVDCDDVNRPFGEARNRRTQHKCGMNGIKFSDAVGQVDDLSLGHSLQNAALEQADVHAVGPKIADEGDGSHERKGEKATFVLHMHETILSLEGLDLMAFLGQGNANLRALQARFPKLRIVARGTELKAMGDRDDLGRFEEVMRMVIWHVDRYNSIGEDDIERLAKSEESSLLQHASHDDVIVYGPGGLKVTARTPNQRRLVEAIREHDMVFAVGPAGSGKTYTAVAMAVAALKDRRVRKIILTRPAVEAGENLGFLPGDLKEKLDPYLQPLYDALTDMLPYERVADHMEKGVIEVAPLAFMRGRTLDKAFVILDEAQNATSAQMRMFLTRMGRDAKFVVTGDGSQVDLPRNQRSGLLDALRLLEDVEGIATVRLTGVDIIRHRLVSSIVDRFDADDARRAEEAEKRRQAKQAERAERAPRNDSPS
jgi:phosphate starvation-inducible protein PhoH and related proteins